MTTALERAQQTVARATQNYVRGGMSYCQQFVGNFWETHFGRGTPNSYPSAAAAYRASQIVSMDPMAAPPGAVHYFEFGSLGHVGVSLGSGLMASGTGRTAGALMDLGRNVLVHRVATYGLRYLGWSYTNGARARIEGLTDHQAPVVAPNQRQVKANATARRRSEPSTLTGTYDGNANIAANAVITPEGIVRSTLPGGQPNGSDAWLVVDGTYVHVSAVTDSGLHDLRDLGTVPAPKPKHAVTIVFGPTESKVVEVVDGLTVSRPGDPERDAFDFQGWAVDGRLYDFATPVTAPFTLEALWSAKPHPEPNPGEGQEPTPEPEDPEEEPMPEKPIIAPDPEQFGNAVEVVTETAAKFLPLEWRKRIMNVTIAVGVIDLAIAGVSAALAPALGGQVGDVLGLVAGVATTIGTLAGTATAILSRANAADPVRTVTVAVKDVPGITGGVASDGTGYDG